MNLYIVCFRDPITGCICPQRYPVIVQAKNKGHAVMVMADARDPAQVEADDQLFKEGWKLSAKEIVFEQGVFICS